MQDVFDITIIGAGPVGLYTAFYACMRGAKVKIIESLEDFGGQPTHLYPEKNIYDIPGHYAIKGSQLTEELIKQLSRFEVSYNLGEEALDIEKETDHITITTSKTKHYTKALIIACGNGAFQPRKLNLENAETYEETNLNYYVNNLDKFKDKEVVIFGGGDSAVDWALALEKVSKKVTIVHRRDKFRAHEHSVNLLQASSVDILTPYTPSELIGDGEKISSVVLSKVRSDETIEVKADEVVVSYGYISSIGEIKNWRLELERNAIVVDEKYQTNIEGIYAVGDIATYPGKLKLIATGFGEGPTAVNNALTYINPKQKGHTVNSTSLFEE